ncbi:alpha/beta fold hydrolase [Pseudonocardia sp. GCM10023141]|uniref:alpha/beta fold hydrolase n=1 Tax=Pseudonocardia sp. GCM10023141 TaxID=3252653 RepID=UPI00360EC13C
MADPLVLLPGLNCSPRLWSTMLDELGSPTVVHGRLDGPTLDDAVAALLHVLPPRFALAGLSMGGIVAMALVRQAPERVSRLCLMATNGRGPTPQQRAGWLAQRSELAVGRTARDVQRDLLPFLLYSRDPELAEMALLMADDLGEQALDGQLAAQATRTDERPALAAVRVPTLVLVGDQDRICPVDRHEEIHALIPGSRLTVLAGVGHLAPLEAPAAVAAALAGWLG